jgi:hypothetical protein
MQATSFPSDSWNTVKEDSVSTRMAAPVH